MTREIKFRAWDKERKVMSIVRSWDFAHGYVEMSKELSPEADKFEHELELMQFTGLVDRNGKEVYEGDIILVKDTYTEKVNVGVGSVPVAQSSANHLCEVIFKHGSFKFVINENADFWDVGEYHLDSEELGSDIEVVGNIYENPELLNQ